jgi:hypothetical protein
MNGRRELQRVEEGDMKEEERERDKEKKSAEEVREKVETMKRSDLKERNREME